MANPDGPILYFDGVCNLCNSVVKDIIRHDRKGVFRFASLQSEAGKKVSAFIGDLSPARDTHPGLRPPLPEKGRGVESGSESPTPAKLRKATPPCSRKKAGQAPESLISAEKQGGSELESGAFSSVILFYKGRYYTKSDAALKVARLLGGWGWLLMPGYLLPRFVRNAIYDAVAKRRYKWFGKKDECMIPTPELKARFLDE